MGKNNTTEDNASSSTAKRARNMNSKIELETFENNKLDESEFHETISGRYTGSTPAGSLLNNEEKPRLKRALKARHVSIK
jgi:amino acid permease